MRFVRWVYRFCPSGTGHFHRETAVNTKNRNERAVTEMTLEISRLRLSCWRRGSESNRRIRVLQTLALPLGYRALWDYNCKIPRRAAQSQSSLIVVNLAAPAAARTMAAARRGKPSA